MEIGNHFGRRIDFSSAKSSVALFFFVDNDVIGFSRINLELS